MRTVCSELGARLKRYQGILFKHEDQFLGLSCSGRNDKIRKSRFFRPKSRRCDKVCSRQKSENRESSDTGNPLSRFYNYGTLRI